MPTKLKPELLTKKEAAKMLGVSESDFAKLEQSKSIPAPRMLAGREKYLRVDIKKAARGLPKATAKKPRGPEKCDQIFGTSG